VLFNFAILVFQKTDRIMSQENSIEGEEKTSQVLQLLEQPMLLIRKGGKLGVSGVKSLVKIIFLFGVINTIIFFFGAYRTVTADIALVNMGYLLLMILVGFGITFFAGYRAYQYAVLDAIGVVYQGMTPAFKKVSSLIVDKAGNAYDSNKELKDGQLSNSIKVENLLQDKFARVPRILKKGIGFILNRVPLVSMLSDLKGEIIDGDREAASSSLYSKMDLFITESVFGSNNTKWVYWLLPLNILIQLLFIKFKLP
jgi:hypothetical protein